MKPQEDTLRKVLHRPHLPSFAYAFNKHLPLRPNPGPASGIQCRKSFFLPLEAYKPEEGEGHEKKAMLQALNGRNMARVEWQERRVFRSVWSQRMVVRKGSRPSGHT